MRSDRKTGRAGAFKALIGAVCMAAGLAAPACAEDAADYPSRPIEFIVQSSAGSSSDTFARELAKAAEPILGQPIAIVYKPGGGGASQMSYISGARPDGYTIGVNTLTHFANMAGLLKGTFSPEDFTWIAMIQEEPHVYVALADAPYNDFAEFAEYVNAKGAPATVGGYGPLGSTVNIAANVGLSAADLPYNWVSFNASSEAVTSLLGGHLEMVAMPPSNALEYVRAGRIKIIAITTSERSDVIPDTPTVTEVGYDIDTSWQQIRGVYGPAGIPDDILAKLSGALLQAAETEEFQTYMHQVGITTRLKGSEEYTAYGKGLMTTATAALEALGLQ